MGFAGVVMATTDTDTQTVTITFSEISEIAASGAPGTLTIAIPDGALEDKVQFVAATTDYDFVTARR